jgi:DNA-binding MarR family transcriptional regulator
MDSKQNPTAMKPADHQASLMPVWRVIHQAFAERVSGHGLAASMAMALLRLHADSESGEPTRLADQICLPRQTMTFVLDDLEKRKLIKRQQHPEDRRRIQLLLTTKGKAKAQEIRDDILEFERQVERQTFSNEQALAFRAAVVALAETITNLNKGN